MSALITITHGEKSYKWMLSDAHCLALAASLEHETHSGAKWADLYGPESAQLADHLAAMADFLNEYGGKEK